MAAVPAPSCNIDDDDDDEVDDVDDALPPPPPVLPFRGMAAMCAVMVAVAEIGTPLLIG